MTICFGIWSFFSTEMGRRGMCRGRIRIEVRRMAKRPGRTVGQKVPPTGPEYVVPPLSEPPLFPVSPRDLAEASPISGRREEQKKAAAGVARRRMIYKNVSEEDEYRFCEAVGSYNQ